MYINRSFTTPRAVGTVLLPEAAAGIECLNFEETNESCSPMVVPQMAVPHSFPNQTDIHGA